MVEMIEGWAIRINGDGTICVLYGDGRCGTAPGYLVMGLIGVFSAH